jgi:hypothetical protein
MHSQVKWGLCNVKMIKIQLVDSEIDEWLA